MTVSWTRPDGSGGRVDADVEPVLVSLFGMALGSRGLACTKDWQVALELVCPSCSATWDGQSCGNCGRSTLDDEVRALRG